MIRGGINVAALFLFISTWHNDSSRPTLSGSEVQVQSQTASSSTEYICRMTQQTQNEVWLYTILAGLQTRIKPQEADRLLQTNCSLRHWKGDETTHDTAPCISRGGGSRTVCQARAMRK